VPYHFGFANERTFGDSRVHVTYCNNPSHLEAINAVTLGRVRARQDSVKTPEEGARTVLSLLVHTDAAFAGQGVVAEGLQLSGLPAYRTGGTIHIVVNNQVGFTTDPNLGRTSVYCTDVARTVGVPVLHVNGDDVDAVVRCAMIAADYRARFQADIVVDLVCYRRSGHNEIDEPAFTQPLMYREIAKHPPVQELYTARAVRDGVLSQHEADAHAQQCFADLDAAYAGIDSYRPNRANALDVDPVSTRRVRDIAQRTVSTGVPLDHLRRVGLALSQPPKGMVANPKIIRQLNERGETIRIGEGISWAFGEALAFATLACEGVGVRFSGQDSPRGAFSQRHFLLVDQETGATVEPFNKLQPGQARCQIIASPLSEYSVLGFEYGYAMDAPDHLVVWEAQFGDFANVAQVVIDQFIASGEDKWLDASGVTLFLPHGLEGQGPDHSSARIERFLQLCANGNMTVANCSTPANLFHLLRRQAYARPRKPLVVFTTKSLLRHRYAVSRLEEFGPGTAFRPVIGANVQGRSVRRVILCSGKLYYDLLAHLEKMQGSDVAIVRLEQLHPFPAEALRAELAHYRDAEVIWCQEEPRNMGAWSYVDRKIEEVLRLVGNGCRWPTCISRPDCASTAIGTADEHNADQAELVRRAVSASEIKTKRTPMAAS
jgi:2-oxoglutarate dehydrogenase E1 component